jgi:beta-galactosidase
MKALKKSIFYFILSLLILIFFNQCNSNQKVTEKREVINLNGTWEITQTMNGGKVASDFQATCPVPGFADMAQPSFDSVGLESEKRNYFWYKTNFNINGKVPDVAILKIHKAKFGTKVYINGKEAGYNLLNFTPTYLEVEDIVKGEGQENELVIRVGTHNTVPDTIPFGKDFEKFYYLPGIFDDVELILSNYPYVNNVQVAPNISNKKIKVQTEIISNLSVDEFKSKYIVKEKNSRNAVAEGYSPIMKLSPGENKFDFTIHIPDAKLWSPESPFLYELEISTGADNYNTSFGMRDFRFDPDKGMAVLNDTPRYLRGTNFCFYRFEEDSLRGDLVWNKKWVTQLHQKYKNSGMNIIRYSVGFPPDFWYDIADSLGILIQDEFNIWTGGTSKADSIRNNTSILTKEFTRWLRERWNHPSVVIWDANNESDLPYTGEALSAVRQLDLSDRPWDNGWGVPQRETDAIESHPYFYIRFWDWYIKENGLYVPSEKGVWYDFFSGDGNPLHPSNMWNTPYNEGQQWPNAVINNEYEWLWLNRGGVPSSVDSNVYRQLCSECTPEERYEYWARSLTAATEYWRCHRKCAATMYFVGLTFSRSHYLHSTTADNFINPVTLEFEPNFKKYVLPAFEPIGLMVDRWENNFKAGEKIEVPVYVINDLLEDWQGGLTLGIYREGKEVRILQQALNIPTMGRQIEKFEINMPEEKGKYQLIGIIHYENKKIKSIRDIEIK